VTEMSGSSITAYIGLGSNLGNREENLNRTVIMLEHARGVKVTTVSSYCNTAPVGYTEQPDFLNAVVEIKTTLPAMELLEVCRQVEAELKRERVIRWGPRTIDLDILLYGDSIIQSESLTIPHPRMQEREFVLGPLKEIAPLALHPVFQKTAAELYASLKDLE
jgi:2-amino-4-hydroxy-6-hydroxymethyldihydropteridine diphosphokinase